MANGENGNGSGAYALLQPRHVDGLREDLRTVNRSITQLIDIVKTMTKSLDKLSARLPPVEDEKPTAMTKKRSG
jgi:hypothetical protein